MEKNWWFDDVSGEKAGKRIVDLLGLGPAQLGCRPVDSNKLPAGSCITFLLDLDIREKPSRNLLSDPE